MMKKLKGILFLLIAINLCSCEKEDQGNTTISGDVGTVVDIDNNSYKIVKINTQWWMAENLKTTHYANGEAIPFVEGDSAWAELKYSESAYCYYDDSLTNESVYGVLYTWSAAMHGQASSGKEPSGVQGVCPNGWHLPSEEEWISLTSYLGGAYNASNKLKETGTTHWEERDPNATNESGFTALPGGLRFSDGASFGIGRYGHWWSSTSTSTSNSTRAYNMFLTYATYDRYIFDNDKAEGLCIRCIMD